MSTVGVSRADRMRLKDSSWWVRHQVIPFGVFMGGLLLLQIAGAFYQVDLPSEPWWRRAPEHWVYALQSGACLFVLFRWWNSYEFHWSWRWSLIGVVFGAVGIGFWILPAHLYTALGLEEEGWWSYLGVQDRSEGFDPGKVFKEGSAAYFSSFVVRFVRAVVVVALVEEIFWRSFLMRLIKDWEGDYWKRPFGEASWLSFGVVTLLFMFAHMPVDYAGALIYGSLTYLLCIWSKNLGACVVMHSVANLLMGWYAIATDHPGLW